MSAFKKIIIFIVLFSLLIPMGIGFASSPKDAPARAPRLLTPRNNAVRTDLKPTLTWTKVTGATRYQLQLTSATAWDPAPEELMDVSFTPANLIARVVRFTDSDYPEPLDWLTRNRPYRWRVRACNGDLDEDCGPWSGTRKFIPRYTAADKPELVAPISDVVTETLSPTFEWVRLPNDFKYELKIVGPGNIRRIKVKPEGEGETVTFTPEFELRGDTHFWWQVRAIGLRNTYFGPWSAKAYFWTPVDTTPPEVDAYQVKLYRPRNNALLNEMTPELIWNRVPNTARYWLQISPVKDFSDAAQLIEDKNITAALGSKRIKWTSYPDPSPFEFSRNRPYYWRVRSCVDAEDANCHAWSNTRRWVPRWIDPDNVPTLVDPGDPPLETVTTLTPDFTWNRLVNDLGLGDGTKARYMIELVNTRNIRWIWHEEVTGSEATATYTPTAALANNVDFKWRVRAVGYRGWYFSPWSEWFYFHTEAAP